MNLSRTFSEKVNAFAGLLRKLPFVHDVRFKTADGGDLGYEGVVTIVDKKKRRFAFVFQVKSSYLDQTSTNATIASARAAEKATGRPMLILARYIPPPTGERLMEAGLNFTDLVGNMHIDLGADHSRTILGRGETRKTREHQPMTAAQLQLLFLFATRPDAVSLPVREIAIWAGVSKSKAAQVRQDLVETGLLVKEGAVYRFHLSKQAEPSLLSGYTQVLRPKLMIGRFQAPERRTEDILKRLPASLKGSEVRYALTGGPAAELLHPFYQGPELPLFVTEHGAEARQTLRILPDRNGPVVLLRAFGELVFWKEISGLTVAPPWLIYAELMQASDPRAHEAAEELRRKYFRQ